MRSTGIAAFDLTMLKVLLTIFAHGGEVNQSERAIGNVMKSN